MLQGFANQCRSGAAQGQNRSSMHIDFDPASLDLAHVSCGCSAFQPLFGGSKFASSRPTDPLRNLAATDTLGSSLKQINLRIAQVVQHGWLWTEHPERRISDPHPGQQLG